MIAPTIIIGLGGIGSDICCRVSKQVTDPAQRSRLRFVCIDTDVNDLSRRQAEDSRLITIQTSAPYVVSKYLETNANAKNNWFPCHNILMGKTPTEGAGQVRAISRLAFDEALREGRMTALDRAIEELYYLDGVAAPQAIRVMVVSTLAGGTGSGIVLPLALYVRHFLEMRFRKSASVIRGFFLLPEIMYGNKSPEECNSLCCNAYASLRELDAFMRRGDGALGPKYDSLRLDLPDAKTGIDLDYTVSPFNFCFLYDKRNTDDLQLKSFDDYMEHAANTIYAQTISGMSNRSNSNEDNVIKPLVRSNGRNRFCGAGSSILKYPRDSVLSYIAGKWCVQNMGTNWLAIDKKYQQYKLNQKERRMHNPTLPDDDSLVDFYIDQIVHAEQGSFEDSIHQMCFQIQTDDIGNEIATSKVDQYMKALNQYISSAIESDQTLAPKRSDFLYQLDRINLGLNNKKGEDGEKIEKSEMEDELHNLNNLCEAYRNACIQVGRSLGKSLSLTLFHEESDATEATEPYRIEYYMKDNDRKFIHPNAARFFIYSIAKKFKQSIQSTKDTCDKLFERTRPFDDITTPEQETLEDYLNSKKRPFWNYVKKKTVLQGKGMIEGMYSVCLEYAAALAKLAIFNEGFTYFSALADAYEKFYNNFDLYLRDTHNEVAEIEHKYVNGEGKATRYVCASERCLKRMLEDMPCTGENSSVNGALSATVFREMKRFAMMVRKPNASNFFEQLYHQSIVGFWKKRVEDSFSSRIDMDVITALEMEAEYEKDESQTDEQKERYAAQALMQAERLAAPFIEEPMGEIRHPFTICVYHPTVSGDADSSRRSFVNLYLNDRMGGQPDENISPYEMMVYKAVYNLKAGDLNRFRCPSDSNPNGGEYYNAYFDTIRQLGPEATRNPVLTPHLDRHWHLTKYLPDLDDENEWILENAIYTALVWGMLTGRVEQRIDSKEEGNTRLLYCPRTTNMERFVISNNTPCDELYEVHDAFAINPPLVEQMIKDMKETMELERRDQVSLNDSVLMRSLSWSDEQKVFGDDYEKPEDDLSGNGTQKFRIRQFAPTQNASIFDLIYWIKASTPADDFQTEQIGLMLDTMLTMLENYVKSFTGKKNMYHRCYTLLVDQYALFLKNLKDPAIRRPRNRICDPCVSAIRDILDDRIQNVYQVSARKRGVMDRLYQAAISDEEQ